jgi:hypothetical protein
MIEEKINIRDLMGGRYDDSVFENPNRLIDYVPYSRQKENYNKKE